MVTLRNTHYQNVDRRNPEAAGVCDRGGEVRKLRDLKKEMEWRGSRLVWNGFLCCDHHRDKPQPFDRTLILPPDPVPVKNPRPPQLLVPIPGVITDGIPTLTETTGVVTDGIGAPLRDTPPLHYPE